MKRMAFSSTIKAIEERRKTVTRRSANTWKSLQPGDKLLALDKIMGFKKGEKATSRPLALLEVTDVRVEPLYRILTEDQGAELEGFPNAQAFLAEFARINPRAESRTEVRRIEFVYLEAEWAEWQQANS